MEELSAADWGVQPGGAAREEPIKRLELLRRTYHGPWDGLPTTCHSAARLWLSCAGNWHGACSRRCMPHLPAALVAGDK